MKDPLFDIESKIVLVAGGACGLGRALSEEFACRGAHLIVADRLVDEGTNVVDSLPGQQHQFQYLDVADQSSVIDAFDEINAKFGKIDVLINSVGIANIAPATKLSIQEFEQTMLVNVTGAFLLSQAAEQLMKKNNGGKIIHLASVSSYVVNPHYAAYSSSKAALSQLVRILALEWASAGITVNAIGPAMTPTPLTERQLLADEKSRQNALQSIPMGRFGTAQDLFGVALLLASSAGAFITGQTIFVDGGRTLI